MQTIKLKGHLFQTLEWIEIDRRADTTECTAAPRLRRRSLRGGSTDLDDDESIHQQHADERVFAREEHVGVAEHAVLEDEQHPQHEERAVLHEDGHDDAEHVRRAARVALLRLRRRRRALPADIRLHPRPGAAPW